LIFFIYVYRLITTSLKKLLAARGCQRLFLLVFFLFAAMANAQEICNNGIDDDADGKIDLNDPECICNTNTVSSIIPNPSFEVYSSCPNSFSYDGNDQLSLATPWVQATSATSDYHNTCGYMFAAVPEAGLIPFPDGNGIAGGYFLRNWNEYIGTALLSPLVSGTNYQLTFDIAALAVDSQTAMSTVSDISDFEPVNVTLYGCANGSNLPLQTTFSPDSFDPTWVEIGHALYVPSATWGQLTITFTPTFNVNAVMIGSPPVLPASYPGNDSFTDAYPYMLYDNLLLDTAAAFGVNIAQAGNFCENNLVLTANPTVAISPSATYQWYLNGIAIIGATGSTYTVPSFASSLGQYSVKITDGTTCHTSSSVTINNALPGPTFTAVQPNCIVPTGSITITSPGFQYSFDNGATWQSSPIKNGLPVGTYYIKITTPIGCVSSATGVTIAAPQLLAGATVTTVQPLTCDGTGSITINSSIASEYSFDDGVTWTTNPSVSNLPPGDYFIKIKDAAGCQSASQWVTIERILMNPPIYTVIQPSCDASGTITITTTADLYSFDDGETWTSNPVASNLLPGYYFIKIKNANGCESYSQYVSLYTSYWDITPTYTAVQPVCGAGGTITINTVASEYSFDGGNTWSTSNSATNLDPGYYQIVVRNSPLCASYSQYIYLDYFYLPDATYTVVQPSCGVGGSITITTISDEYSFDGGSTWVTSNIATNLNPGTYYIMIKNALGCTSNYQYVNLNYFYLADPTYTVVDPGCGNPGSITITTPADEYSFDGGFTWTPNPVLTNLFDGYYYIKIRNGSGCESNYLYVYLSSTFIQSPVYTVVQPSCTANGTITITSTADQYSFDGGLTWSLSNIGSNLPPGSYQVQTKDANGCVSQIEYVYLNTSYLDSPSFTVVDPFCTETTGIITIAPVAGCEYSFDNGTTYQASNVSGPLPWGYYNIKIKNSIGCESMSSFVSIDPPSGIPATPTGSAAQLFCIFNSPTVAFLSANGQNIQWYAQASGGTALPANTPLQDGNYYASETVSGCENPVRLAVAVTLSNFVIPASDYSILVCDDLNDQTETVDLSDYNSNIITDTTDYTFTYFTSFIGADTKNAVEQITNSATFHLIPGNNLIYVRAENTNGCWRVATLALDMIPSPVTSMPAEYFLCENHIVVLRAEQGYDSYLWSNGATTYATIVNQPGTYTVTVTENHGSVVCSSTQSTTVTLSNPATITEVIPTDWTDFDNEIEINLSGTSIGDYEYSIDGVNFQSSNHFTGLACGPYTVYVHDKHGCGTVDKDVYLLMYPRFFTPNGDGVNDEWRIKFSSYEPGILVQLFDRQGKFIKEFHYLEGWDGTYNGEMLPSTDYWFLVTREDGTQYRGHFAMKR
jgi:gliding motility-associated-like protein